MKKILSRFVDSFIAIGMAVVYCIGVLLVVITFAWLVSLSLKITLLQTLSIILAFVVILSIVDTADYFVGFVARRKKKWRAEPKERKQEKEDGSNGQE